MNENEIKKNGWNEWAKYVLVTLDELKKQHGDSDKKIEDNKDTLMEAINDLKVDIRVLQTKMTVRSTLSGAIAGFIPALGLLIYFLLKL